MPVDSSMSRRICSVMATSLVTTWADEDGSSLCSTKSTRSSGPCQPEPAYRLIFTIAPEISTEAPPVSEADALPPTLALAPPDRHRRSGDRLAPGPAAFTWLDRDVTLLPLIAMLGAQC